MDEKKIANKPATKEEIEQTQKAMNLWKAALEFCDGDRYAADTIVKAAKRAMDKLAEKGAFPAWLAKEVKEELRRSVRPSAFLFMQGALLEKKDITEIESEILGIFLESSAVEITLPRELDRFILKTEEWEEYLVALQDDVAAYLELRTLNPKNPELEKAKKISEEASNYKLACHQRLVAKIREIIEEEEKKRLPFY